MDRGGNYWTLFTPGIWKDLHAVLQSAGKITNCQIGVFAAYASRHGHAFIDRALYLPKAWTDDPARLAAAHVSDGTGFATKPALAIRMIERAITAGVPFRWVAADSVYGVSDIEMPRWWPTW